MLKHLYKAIILAVIFSTFIFLFGKNIKEEEIEFNTTVEMNDPTFPILYLISENAKINLLHGYSGNIEANLIRDCITPLKEDKTFSVIIDEKESIVKKIKYEVREVFGNALIDSGSISALEVNDDDKKTAKIRIKANLEMGKEYTVLMMAVTDTSKKIRYYTRVKMSDSPHIKENLEFVMNFHNSILDKKRANDIIKYLEPDVTKDNTSLSLVTINSSFDLVSWGNLRPKVVGEVIPTLKEVNSDNSSIELKYMVSSETKSGTEYYEVQEYYRVRWSSTRMYLLNYDRTMEAVFDVDLIDLQKSELKIGISNKDKFDIVTSDDNNKLCFVRERALWYYNLLENKMVSVFNFAQQETDYIRDRYDQHDTRILNMDEDGNIDFLVYGYMNRGDYEGRVAIVLYKYLSGDNRIEEQVYIPIDIPYQMLKEDLDNFSYVSASKVFYFSMNNTIYGYNIITKEQKEIVTDISAENLAMPKGGQFISWQDNRNPKEAKSIHILDLEKGKEKVISAKKDDNIIILGNIDFNIIYGYCKTKDITKGNDGSYQTPLYKVEIANSMGIVLKTYEKKGYYVVRSRVNENVVELERVIKKVEVGKTTFKKTDPDYILNKVVDTRHPISLTSRVSEDKMTQLYLSMPGGFVMKEMPSVINARNTIITEDTTLNLAKPEKEEKVYYVYALGEIAMSFTKAAEAIVFADKNSGVVVNKEQQLIWARGGKLIRSEIIGINPIYASTETDNIRACINMILRYNKLSIVNKKTSNDEYSIYDILSEYLGDKTISLTGCTLEEVLYFVSEKRPVIAMKDKNNAVIIIAYDEFNITIIDPSSNNIKKIGLNDGSKLFGEAGNLFISYTN